MRVVVEYWDEEQGRKEDIVILNILDEDVGVVEGVVDGARLTDEQLGYAIELDSRIMNLKDEYLLKVYADFENKYQAFQLNDGNQSHSWRKIIFVFNRMRRMQNLPVVSTQLRLPSALMGPAEVRIYCATLITSNDELDDTSL